VKGSGVTSQPSLPANVSVLRSPISTRNHQTLPAQPTPLLGRDAEVAALRARLGDASTRILTLTGPGGIGKTRLALAAIAGLVDHFPQGAVFVDLVPVRDATRVPAAIAQALDVRPHGTGSDLAAVVAAVQEQQVLLLLDNFEQVVAAAGDVAELVAACPGVKVLVTSRAPLLVRWEQEFPVAPLALPDFRLGDDLDALAASPAVALFVQRALGVRPDFALTHGNARDVAAICARLQGMPLPIELAAARVRILPPRALLTRLESGAGGSALQLLSGGARDLPERQRSLRDTIAWSHDLLSPMDQLLFRRLAVFTGGCTVAAAEAICAGFLLTGGPDLPADMVLDGLASLVEKSLVVQHDDAGSEPRFSMLETVHEFSQEQLAAGREAEAIRRRHAHHFLQYAESGQRERRGSQQAAWLQCLEADHHNLRAALAWTLAAGEGALAVRFCAALAVFWRVKGYFREGRDWNAQALAAAPQAPVADRAAAIEGAGTLAYVQRDLVEARRLMDAGVELWRTVGDGPRLAFALAYRGMLARDSGDPVTARASCTESLTIPIARSHGSGHRLALSVLGFIVEAEGDGAAARRLQEESLAVAREISPMDTALQLTNAGVVALHAGEVDTAAGYYREGLQLSRDIAAPEVIACCLEGFAGVTASGGRPQRAAALLGAATALRAVIGSPPIARFEEERRRIVSLVEETLGEESFAAARAAGAATPLTEMITLALAGDNGDVAGVPPPVGVSGSTRRGETPAMPPHRLTARQVDYLRLLARGLTNKAIAAELVVSEPGVETMLVRLYEKIQVSNRAEAIRFAYAHGLHEPPTP
jgi:predicted ATPase/DNA-binding CsgD family transcriptional regulator